MVLQKTYWVEMISGNWIRGVRWRIVKDDSQISGLSTARGT